jgi:DNA polymerase-3 subunit gamma/tau
MRAQMNLVHRITIAQLGQSGADARSSEEREAIEGWAKGLSAGQLHRLWQLVLKGHDEVRFAPDPLAAAQMALLRVMHAADLPDPGGLARKLQEIAANASPPAVTHVSPGAGVPAAAIDWEQLVSRVEDSQPLIGGTMRNWVRPVEVTNGTLLFQLVPGLTEDPARDMADALDRLTGERWRVERSVGEAQPSLRERKESEERAGQAALLANPLVKAAFAAFPDAELIDEERAERSSPPWSRRA